MSLLKNAVKYLLIISLLSTVPVYAKRHKQVPILQDRILATNYVVQDLDSGEILAEQGSGEIRSIASITKLMTVMVILDAGQDLNEMIDVKSIAGISGGIGNNRITRSDLITLALMSSNNLAAKTLAIHYPGGEEGAIISMNMKAFALGMTETHYADSTGLLDENTSTAHDLVTLLRAAENYTLIKEASTTAEKRIELQGKKNSHFVLFHTTNNLILKMPEIVISKTGWIRKSGGCLMMAIHDQGRRLAVILLNSKNTHTRLRDAELLYGLQHGQYNTTGNRWRYNS
jgi:D-alanyl-D-alanine endopeptidase (penicillin-binding protein 7)